MPYGAKAPFVRTVRHEIIWRVEGWLPFLSKGVQSKRYMHPVAAYVPFGRHFNDHRIEVRQVKDLTPNFFITPTKCQSIPQQINRTGCI